MSKILSLILLLLFCYTSPAQTSWELLNPKPSYETGKKVVFTSADKGFIITGKDLLYTEDAGATWKKKETLFGANDINFLEDLGYVVGSNGFVFVSKNGGETWNQLQTGTTQNLNTVQIINNKTIILSGSTAIQRTDDGGATWQTYVTKENYKINKTYFTSNLVGHAVCNGGIILKTSDGGKTWKVTESTNIYPNNFFTVQFINENIGFATKEHSSLLKTTDGGETWQNIHSNMEAIYSLFFLDENKGFAAGEYGTVYKTLDGGTSWQMISFQNSYVDYTSIHGIYFQNPDMGFIVGARGMIHKTIDGGKTWQPNSAFYTNVQNLQFPSANVGYATTSGSLLKSNDGGKTWAVMGSPSSGSSIAKLDFIDEKIGYATAGGQGSVYSVWKTMDGGVSWVKTNKGQDIMRDNLYSIDFLDEKIGFVSGGYNQRQIFKTTNGGDNWLTMENLSFNGIQFPTKTTGYGLQVNYMSKKVYKTTDLGENWQVVLETEDRLTSMDFITEDLGFVSGEEGVMYKTTNGGASWEKLEVPYEDYMHVRFYNENVGYALDDDRGIWKTINSGFSWDRISSQSGITAIHILENKEIYLSGVFGRILRSTVNYFPYSLSTGPAEEIYSNTARLTGNATSNNGIIKELQVEYGTDNKFDKVKTISPNTVEPGKSLNINASIDELLPGTTYQYRLKASYDGKILRSGIREFTTKPEYELTIYSPSIDRATNTVKAMGIVTSYKSKISEIEFEYGTEEAPFSNAISTNPSEVGSLTLSDVVATITGLKADTEYTIRIKAFHDGKIIYSQPQKFRTHPEYKMTLNSVRISNNSASFSAFVTALTADIKDLVFEYGSSNFEHEIAATPATVDVLQYANITATTGALEPEKTYYYRLKGVMDGKTIYSATGVFNLSYDPIVIPSGVNTQLNRSVKIEGIINPSGKFLTNIRFEYGLGQEFDLSAPAQPSTLGGYNTFNVSAVLDNLEPDSSYNFRIKAQEGSKMHVSKEFSFLTEAAVYIGQDVLSLQVINETCAGKNNGSFILDATEDHDFTAMVNGEEYDFTSQLKLEDLSPGLYKVCVTAAYAPDFQQCFEFEITAGKSLAGMAIMAQTAGNNVYNISLQEGTAPFNVSLNGRIIAKHDSRDFSVKVKQGDRLEISSNAACEGVLIYDVDLKNKVTAFPNPATSILNILISNAKKREVQVDLHTNTGRLISSEKYRIIKSTVSVPVDDLPSGLYFAVIKLNPSLKIKFSKK